MTKEEMIEALVAADKIISESDTTETSPDTEAINSAYWRGYRVRGKEWNWLDLLCYSSFFLGASIVLMLLGLAATTLFHDYLVKEIRQNTTLQLIPNPPIPPCINNNDGSSTCSHW